MEPTQTYAKHHIANTEDYSLQELVQEIENGGRFVVFPYGIGLIGYYHEKNSVAHFLPHGQSHKKFARPYIWISILFGWLFPTGPWNAWKNIKTCRNGGIDVTYDILPSLSEEAFKKKTVETRNASRLFRNLSEGEYQLMRKCLNPILEKYPEIEEFYIGKYINTGADEPFFFFGYNPIADCRIFEYEAKKALAQEFTAAEIDAMYFAFLGEDELTFQLIRHGRCFRTLEAEASSELIQSKL